MIKFLNYTFVCVFAIFKYGKNDFELGKQINYFLAEKGQHGNNQQAYLTF